MAEPCEGRTEHHTGCPCHEAKRDAEVAALRAEVAALRADLATATTERDRLRADMREVLGAAEALADIGAARAAMDLATVEGHRDDLREALTAVTAERDALLGQLAAHQRHTDAAVDGVRATLPRALDIARREAAEAMLARCRGAAREAFDSHPLTLDRYHAPGCICDAIGRGSCSECDRGEAISEALDRLALDAPTTGGVS